MLHYAHSFFLENILFSCGMEIAGVFYTHTVRIMVELNACYYGIGCEEQLIKTQV